MVQVESKLVPRKENGEKPTMSGPDKWFTGQVYLDIAEQHTTDDGGKAKRINEGDVMWCPPGAHHWHGADDGAIMSHFVFALGKTH
ncbi:hypothetical protein E4T42_08417 [Aureobasidium subglaciale]|nr:hypothetical protein E4T42_08417 [Aureobasidium subglaciale]